MSTLANRIYLFSANFPFEHNGGEISFLTPEILVLKERFDIIFVPTNPYGKRIEAHKNSSVDTSYSRACHGIGAFLSLISSCIYIELWKEAIELLKRSPSKGIIDFIAFCIRYSAARNWLRRNHPTGSDILYTYWCTGTTLGLLSSQTSKVITRAHRYDLYYEDNEIGYIFGLHRIYKRIHGFFTISEHGKQYLIEKFGPSPRLFLARLGVPEKSITTTTSEDNILRVLSVSNIIKVKRVELILVALREVLRRNPNTKIEWTHIGDGLNAGALRKQCEHSNNPNFSIHFLGNLTNEAVCKYYEENPIDVFVHASQSEGLPVAIQEALSYSVPVIAIDVGGISEAISISSGLLVNPSQPSEGLVFAIEKFLLLTEAQRTTMRNDSKSIHNSKFDSNKNFRDFSKILRESI